MAEPKTFPVRVNLPPALRGQMIALLNQQLCDLLDLYSQIKQAHWNVKGPHFHQLHLLFDSLAEQVEDHADTTAERAVALGGVATGTARQVAAGSRLPEYPAGVADGLALVAAVADRYAALGTTTRAAIRTASDAGDDGTADLFTGLSRDLDKSTWFLEAHLQGK